MSQPTYINDVEEWYIDNMDFDDEEDRDEFMNCNDLWIVDYHDYKQEVYDENGKDWSIDFAQMCLDGHEGMSDGELVLRSPNGKFKFLDMEKPKSTKKILNNCERGQVFVVRQT
jgi:hypothetical protein